MGGSITYYGNGVLDLINKNIERGLKNIDGCLIFLIHAFIELDFSKLDALLNYKYLEF